jgi:glutamate-5-semialdehyde dehydrogenase
LATLPTDVKNQILKTAADLLLKHQAEILEANAIDINKAKMKGIKGGIFNRLLIDTKGIQNMVKGLMIVASLEDPIGEMTSMK